MPRLGKKKNSKFEDEFQQFLDESNEFTDKADIKISEKPWWMKDEDSTESSSLKHLGTGGKAFLKKSKTGDKRANGMVDPLHQYYPSSQNIHPGGDEPANKEDLKLTLPLSDHNNTAPADDVDGGDPERRLRGAVDPHYSQDMMATLAGYTGSGFSTTDNSSTLAPGHPEQHKSNINNFTGPTTAEFATVHNNTSMMAGSPPRGLDYFGTGAGDTNTAGPSVRFSTVISEIEDDDNDDITEPQLKNKSLAAAVPASSMLSQVSLHDSYEDTTMSRPAVTRHREPSNDSDDMPDHRRGQINFDEFEAQNDQPPPGEMISRPPTQYFSQLSTGTGMGGYGETTAADLSNIHAAYRALDGTGNTDGGLAAGGLTTLNDPTEPQSEDQNAPSSIITTQSFGIKAMRPSTLLQDLDQIDERERSPSPVPTPRSQNKIDIQKASLSRNGSSQPIKKTAPQTRRFSNVKSSGYGRKSLSPNSSQQRPSIPGASSAHNSRLDNRSNSRSIERKSHRPVSGNSSLGRTRQPHQGHQTNSTTTAYSGGPPTKWEARSSSGVASGSRDAEDQSLASRASMMSVEGPGARSVNIRELQLKEEIDEWREKYREERKLCAKAKSDLMLSERDHNKEIDSLNIEHEQTVARLQSQISMLQHRIDEKVPLINRKLPADISKDDIVKLEKHLEEQEILLSGYQKENERLYTEIKKLQLGNKQSEHHFLQDSQKLHQELSSVKLELERRNLELKSINQKEGANVERQFAMSGLASGNPADVATVRYELESDLRSVRNELNYAQKKIRDLEIAKEKAESKIDQMLAEQSKKLSREEQEKAINSIEVQKLRDRHQEEVNDLKKKIKWYLENQAILNRDAQKLKEKDKQIADLEDKLSRLQSGERIQISGSIRSKERSHDAAKIKRLEEEVAYLKCKLDTETPADSKTRSKVRDYLESRVQELEQKLDDRNEDEERALRSLEQQHLVIKAKYEDQIQSLEAELSGNAPEESKRMATLQIKVDQLEDQIKQKNQIIQRQKRDLLLLKKQSDPSQLGKTFPVKKNIPQDKNNNLKNELSEKDSEIARLKQQLREAITRPPHDRRSHHELQRTFAFPEPSLDISIENDKLKREVNDLRRQVEHCRLVTGSALTQGDLSANHVRAEMEQKLMAEREQFSNEIQKVKIHYSQKHSQTRVAELQAQVDSQELVIGHLKEQLARNSVDSRALEVSRAIEKEAKERIDKLTQELAEAKAYHTPQMRQFDQLKAKVIALEEKQKYRESNVEQYIERRVSLAQSEAEKEALKWRRLVEEKNHNLAVAKAELDKLLETLEELQRQGVILPMQMKTLARVQKRLGQDSHSSL